MMCFDLTTMLNFNNLFYYNECILIAEELEKIRGKTTDSKLPIQR